MKLGSVNSMFELLEINYVREVKDVKLKIMTFSISC